MNMADKAWRIDRQISKLEKQISEIILCILDLNEINQDSQSEEASCFALNEKLADLRFELASLPEAPTAIPMVRYA
jgi:hypothetical protein